MRNSKGQFLKGHQTWTGKHLSEKHRSDIGKAHKGKKHKKEHIEKRAIGIRKAHEKKSWGFTKGRIPWNKGKKCLGIAKTQKWREAMAKLKGRVSPMKGRKQSVETKAKMSKAHKGKKLSMETREKMKRKKSDITKRKISLAKIGKRLSPEHCKHISEARINSSKCKGENHWHWKGGIWNLKNDNKRNDPMYKRWVNQVKKRDKNICRMNNDDCCGYNIVHHICPWATYPELRYNINNGITLCQFHHPRKRTDEKRLIPFFKRLVEVERT